jgi:hypothetical protein
LKDEDTDSEGGRAEQLVMATAVDAFSLQFYQINVLEKAAKLTMLLDEC